MERPEISVVIITKNEERNIEDCLKSVLWADEIVIVDSFSTDKTVEIAKKYTDKIYFREFTTFEEQRNFANQKATKEWILSLDADERVTLALKDEILEAIKNEASKNVAYRIPHLDYMFGKEIYHGGWYPQYHVRLYKKDYAVWSGRVHERIQISGEIGYLKNPILHFSHLTISNFIQKLDRYTSMEAIQLYEQGYRTNVIKIIFLPIGVFVYKYLFKLGFLDGIHGLVLANSLAYYHFIKNAKLWELYYNDKKEK